MTDLIEDLKQRARVLHRQARAGDGEALASLRRVRELSQLDEQELRQAVQRKHCLALLAQRAGFSGWSHLTNVLGNGSAGDDFGTALHRDACFAHWNIWFADYAEACAIRDDHGGYLLPYKRQFLIVDEHYLETLGLDPSDADWSEMGRDWVTPRSLQARQRLYGKLLTRAA